MENQFRTPKRDREDVSIREFGRPGQSGSTGSLLRGRKEYGYPSPWARGEQPVPRAPANPASFARRNRYDEPFSRDSIMIYDDEAVDINSVAPPAVAGSSRDPALAEDSDGGEDLLVGGEGYSQLGSAPGSRASSPHRESGADPLPSPPPSPHPSTFSKKAPRRPPPPIPKISTSSSTRPPPPPPKRGQNQLGSKLARLWETKAPAQAQDASPSPQSASNMLRPPIPAGWAPKAKDDEWIQVADGATGSAVPPPARGMRDDASSMAGGASSASMRGPDSEFSYQEEPYGRPRRGKEIQKGYYRLYTPSGALYSINPVYQNDPSLSSCDLAHVSPPFSAHEYISYIAGQERLKTNAIKMYMTRPGRGPRCMPSSDPTTLSVTPTPENPLLFVVELNGEIPGRKPPKETTRALPSRGLEKDLHSAYYRLFGVGLSARGAQRPMPSSHWLYEDDLSLSKLFVEFVPPPLRARDYIAYIGELEGIHPSRITLFLRPKTVGSELTFAKAAREVTDLEEIITVQAASSTREEDPIMVKVQLESDRWGHLHFGKKGVPISVMSTISKRLSILM